jgi:hypothetical protein
MNQESEPSGGVVWTSLKCVSTWRRNNVISPFYCVSSRDGLRLCDSIIESNLDASREKNVEPQWVLKYVKVLFGRRLMVFFLWDPSTGRTGFKFGFKCSPNLVSLVINKILN